MDKTARPCGEETIMFIEPWMRLLGHAVEETTESWMRQQGHAVEETSMFIELYVNQQLRNCWITKGSLSSKRLLHRSGEKMAPLSDTYIGKCQISVHFMNFKYLRRDIFPALL